ncbi:MAG: hypothetical protein ABJF23_19440 [Bryobacteraceae bacterium]
MRSSRFALFGLLAVSLLVPARGADQPTQKPKYLILTTYHVKPSAEADFADLLKNKWMPAMKKGGASPRIYSMSGAGGRAATFVISSTTDSLSLFDGKTALVKGAGEGDAARMIAQRSQLIDDRTVTILRRREEMSVYPETLTNSPLLLVQHVKAAPGKNQEFIALWKSEVLSAVKKSGVTVSTWSVILGDESHFSMTIPLSSYADLDKGVSAAQMSMTPEEYERFNVKIGPLFTSLHREVLRLRTDLMGLQ